ncbi:AAA-like domain-containing protein [Leptolyngbya cf. ectocarpi LEGE 11479]|uniref:AAA-like domain-containing protein n=1 Tax=Leptolyngbya cf. ectocarpi LEGE 11479 TaxID=1828722 RepID=A0A928ZVQ8_LEPEC|nr:AAA-like domain-containing protein [Leptolyngbya ectocarpi]MBE9068326.1 AAA-like domain-containing protein [Leptolyngbya cf. ectocarpi LEGE 11479]
MDVDTLVLEVERLLQRRLGTLERLVLHESWCRRSYAEIAQSSSYATEYIKQVGSKLWSELSAVLGESVSKKSLRLILTPDRLLQTHQLQTVGVAKQAATAGQTLPNGLGQPRNTLLPPGDLTAATRRFPSGPLSLESPLYVERLPQETNAFNELSYPGCLLRIKGPRRMGKSSLLNRLLAHSRRQGYHTVTLNFQEVDREIFDHLDRFLRWLCANASQQLGLPSKVDALWDEEMGSKVNCKLYFERYLLQEISSPLVLGIDELNRIFGYGSIVQDFLPMLRVWHERSKDSEIWQKLRLILVHATDLYVPLNLNQSPFNVGLPIKLAPFTLEQLTTLAYRYGVDSLLQDRASWHSFYQLINGHPYLAGLAFYTLQQGQRSLDQIVSTAATTEGIYNQHLQRCLAMLKSDPSIATSYHQVVTQRSGTVLDAIASYKLDSLGLIRFDQTLVKPSCELYRLYFSRQLDALERQ